LVCPFFGDGGTKDEIGDEGVVDNIAGSSVKPTLRLGIVIPLPEPADMPDIGGLRVP
jgi:hypothetical protein